MKAVELLRTYLCEKDLCEDFEKLTEAELDSALYLFYVEILRLGRDYYKAAPLYSIRSGYLPSSKGQWKVWWIDLFLKGLALTLQGLA